ncbi:MAG: hypothetical protein AMXMBFR83_23310 [Phycisphaerae bacterium]
MERLRCSTAATESGRRVNNPALSRLKGALEDRKPGFEESPAKRMLLIGCRRPVGVPAHVVVGGPSACFLSHDSRLSRGTHDPSQAGHRRGRKPRLTPALCREGISLMIEVRRGFLRHFRKGTSHGVKLIYPTTVRRRKVTGVVDKIIDGRCGWNLESKLPDGLRADGDVIDRRTCSSGC